MFKDDGIGNWSLAHTLTASDAAAGDLFGFSLALDSTTAIIGASGDNDKGLDSGSAYFFEVTTGQQVDKVHAFDGASFDSFGFAVAIEDQRALVGANFDLVGGLETGSAYLFEGIQSGDFDEDGTVDGLDLADWQGGFGTLNPDHRDGDANLDNDVDGFDYLTWQRQFEGSSLAAVHGQVPEPGNLSLCLAAGGLLYRRLKALR